MSESKIPPLEYISDDTLFEGEFSQVFLRHYKDKKGTERRWALTHEATYGPSEAILAITPERMVILERSYRITLRDHVIELPGGRADVVGEVLGDVARRELLEETGYQASTIKPLGMVYEAPGQSDAACMLFLAEDVVRVSEPILGDSEIIETILVPFDAVFRALAEPEYKIDGKVFAALGMYFAKKQLS